MIYLFDTRKIDPTMQKERGFNNNELFYKESPMYSL